MSSTESGPENLLRFKRKQDIRNGKAAAEIKHRYGRGIYVNNISETSEDDLVITLANSVPRDVSDSREQDRVMQFINIRNIHHFRAENTGEGYYIVDLPDRDAVHEGFVERREQIIGQLEYRMANIIYDHVFELTPVKNQLNAIIQIIRWTREHHPLAVERIAEAQRSDNSEEYIRVLADLGFLEVEEGDLSPGDKMRSADLQGLDNDEFMRRVIGDIVKAGYNVLKDQLDLGMLSHYPRYSNAYYETALQREDSELWLDVEAVRRNYQRQYGEEQDWLVVNDKLNELKETNVLQKDGEFVQSKPDVYNQLAQAAPVY